METQTFTRRQLYDLVWSEPIQAGGWRPYRRPGRPKKLDGLEAWLEERLVRHRGNADVVRQELAAELGVKTTLRTVERAVEPFRQRIEAERRATVRFETSRRPSAEGRRNRTPTREVQPIKGGDLDVAREGVLAVV